MILQSLEALEKDLKSSRDRSFYLILGPEQYQCRTAVDLIKRTLLNSESIAFDYCSYSVKDTPVERIFETANTFPMLSNRRLVLVTELENLAQSEHDKLLRNLESVMPSTLLILVAEELDHRKKLYKTIRDKGCIAEFPMLKGASLKRWVEESIRKKGYRVSSATAAKIVDMAGSDLQSLAGELEKLFLYAGKEKQITDAAVEELVRNSRQHGIFELIDAIARRDRAAALNSLTNLLGMGEYPLVIVSMMARHSRQVLIVQECIGRGMRAGEAGKVAQVPPFMLEKFVRQAGDIDLGTVRRMHTGLSDIDRRLKSSSVDARILLEVFISALI
ncbi:MAG: DNA polymerase III subunit delta [Acidobacteria bacterium]|nr:DNA polymerase III subunit delta [Acidobacteriota bacterium]